MSALCQTPTSYSPEAVRLHNTIGPRGNGQPPSPFPILRHGDAEAVEVALRRPPGKHRRLWIYVQAAYAAFASDAPRRPWGSIHAEAFKSRRIRSCLTA